jgi:opacity protein-like surface antigen
MRTRVPMTVRITVLFCFISLLSLRSVSQSITTANGKLEVGLGLGPSFFLGDLGGNYGIGTTFIKDVNLPLTKLSKGVFVSIFPSEWLGFRFALNHTYIEGIDSIINVKGGAEQFRFNRNLTFRSYVAEAYVAMEFYPVNLFGKFDGALFRKLHPYGIIGVGAFRFNPQGLYTNPAGQQQWVDLKPLRLEGQGMAEYPDRKEYSLTQLEIPMGFGVKYFVKENMFIGLEILHRKTFTDYIDDVSTRYIDPALFNQYLSPQQAAVARYMAFRENNNRPHINDQRGDPKENDAWFSSIIRMGWRLGGSNYSAIKQMRCPVYY